MLNRQPAVYIMTNKRNGTLYMGVTCDLITRVYQHKEGVSDGFTKKYQCKQRVCYEQFDEMIAAIAREKQIKAGSRKKKLTMIESVNPTWNDLYETLL